MIVEPDLPQHPKFIKLRSALGPRAMEVLVLLWGHCHAKRGEFWDGATPEYVEYVVNGNSKGTKNYDALLDARFIEKKDGGILVHDWQKTNASLVANWTRNAIWRASRDAASARSAEGSADPSKDTAMKASGTGPRGGSTRPDQTRPDQNISTTTRGGGGLEEQKVQFAALSQLIETAERQMGSLTAEERQVYRKNRAALAALQEKQARGAFA